MVSVSKGPQLVAVPDVAGERLPGGAGRARPGRVRPGQRPSASSATTVPEGVVISTAPGAGDRKRRGSEVDLVVSRGPSQVTLPDLRGKPRQEAEATVEAAGPGSRRSRSPAARDDGAGLRGRPAARAGQHRARR